MFKTILSFLGVLSLLAVPVFAIDDPATEVCSIDQVPAVDFNTLEARPTNPANPRTGYDQTGFPVLVWDYRTSEEGLYVRYFTIRGVESPETAFILSYACFGSDDYRLALRVDGHWLAAKYHNVAVKLANIQKDSDGNITSATASLETDEGLKEIVVQAK